VKNYRGVNSSYGKDRTLIVKEGRAGHFVPPTSSLPEWFHPGYYDSADKVYLKLRRPPSASAKVPFKNSGRYPSEDDDMEKARKRMLKSRLNFIPTASLAGSHAPTDSVQMNSDSSATAVDGGCGGTSPEYFYYSIYTKSSSHHHQHHQQQHSNRTSSPGYASPGKCSRPHSQFTETGLFNPSNPWTSSSSSSTINSPVHHGSVSSPRTIHFSSSSYVSLPSSRREGYASMDELNSQYFDQQTPLASYRSSSLSSLHSNTNPTASSIYSDSLATATDHDVSLTTVDSLLIKAATRQRKRYQVPDYTLGALDQQSVSKLVIPPMEFPELDAEIKSLANPSRTLPMASTGMRPGLGQQGQGSGSPSALLGPGGSKTTMPISSTGTAAAGAPLPSSAVLNTMNKNMKEKEKEKQQLESLYAVTTAATATTTTISTATTITPIAINLSSSSPVVNSGTEMSPLRPTTAVAVAGVGDGEAPGTSLQRMNKKDKGIHKNKANQTLDSIKSSLSVTKSSVVLNEEIPFDRKMTSYIDQWTRERNFVETDLMRPRQCICRYSVDDKKNKNKKSKKGSEVEGTEEEEERREEKEGDDDESSPFISLGMTSDEQGVGGSGGGYQSLQYDESDRDDFTELTAEDSSVFSA
jgi:hypothetical protein